MQYRVAQPVQRLGYGWTTAFRFAAESIMENILLPTASKVAVVTTRPPTQ
jgi:hypothetical protein